MENQIMSWEVIGIYKQMLELQSSNHNIAVTILLLMTAMLLWVTWYWNKQWAKQFIRLEVQKSLSENTTLMLVDLRKTIKENIDSEFVSHEKNMKRIEAEVCRSMAISASSDEEYGRALEWFSRALELWIDLWYEERIRLIVDLMKDDIDLANLSDSNKISTEHKDMILKTVSRIPLILKEERDFLYKKINKFFISEE